MLAKIILIILGVALAGFAVTALVLFGYELWKESELRADILKKKEREKETEIKPAVAFNAFAW